MEMTAAVNPPEFQPEPPLADAQEPMDIITPLPRIDNLPAPERHAVSYDSETFRFRPGVQFPKLVIGSVCNVTDLDNVGLYDPDQCVNAIIDAIVFDIPIVGQQISYDMGVLCAYYPKMIPDVFNAYKTRGITDTKLREQILDIGNAQKCRVPIIDQDGRIIDPGCEGYPDPGGYALSGIVKRRFNISMDKDTWRLRYSTFDGMQPDELPEGAQHYAKDDAYYAGAAYRAQGKVPDYQYSLAYSTFTLQLASGWGMRTDRAFVERYEKELHTLMDPALAKVQEHGYVDRYEVADTKRVARDMFLAYEAKPPITPNSIKKPRKARPVNLSFDFVDNAYDDWYNSTGLNIALGALECKESGDPKLMDYSEYVHLRKALQTDIPLLYSGCEFPIHPQLELAASGRTTCRAPNLQNLPRTGLMRLCFIPRSGYYYAQADYPGLENRCFAQVCKAYCGFSVMGDLINDNVDVLSYFGAAIRTQSSTKTTYDDMIRMKKEKHPDFKIYRSMAKGPIYGLPGGMGGKKLKIYCKVNYGIDITEDQGIFLKNLWMETFPEVIRFFEWVESTLGTDGIYRVPQLFTDRIRATPYYTSACNTTFQGLGSDASRLGFNMVSEKCYCDSKSPLYGSRPVILVHDEIICEVPREISSEAADCMAEEFSAGANVFLPDYPLKAEPTLMRRWIKDAPSERTADGKLICFDSDGMLNNKGELNIFPFQEAA